MGRVRPLVERRVLRWRTHRNRTVVIRHLDLLAVALKPKGYRCIKLYRADEFPLPLSLLWIFACRPDDHAGVAVSVEAVPGGTWAFYEAARGRCGYLSPCRDTKAAAERVDAILKHRMFPGSW